MQDFIETIAICVERGKISKNSPYPPDLKDQDGADEIAAAALKNGVNPALLLDGCMLGMERIGKKFSENKVFVPELLMSAKAMTAVMDHLRPFLESGEVKHKGKFIIGTVSGDLHDIGKNLVAMTIKGGGYEVIDLGVDVSPAKYLDVLEKNPEAFIASTNTYSCTVSAAPIQLMGLPRTASIRACCKALVWTWGP